jgi:hypothetical protein
MADLEFWSRLSEQENIWGALENKRAHSKVARNRL